MDHIVVKTDRLGRLTRIAEMSTFHLMQSDLYITLAHAVEEYMVQPTTENHAMVDKILSTCKRHFSDYDNLRTVLAGELQINGNLRVAESTHIREDQVVESVDTFEQQTTELEEPSIVGNITYVDFTKKR